MPFPAHATHATHVFFWPTPPTPFPWPTQKFYGTTLPTANFDPHNPWNHAPTLLKLFSILFQSSNDSSCAFVTVISITFISAKLARFLILKVPGILKRHQFLTSPLLDTKVFSASHSINISFSCDTRSESRKWMGICRFEIKNIFLFRFRLTVLWSFQ